MSLNLKVNEKQAQRIQALNLDVIRAGIPLQQYLDGIATERGLSDTEYVFNFRTMEFEKTITPEQPKLAIAKKE